MTMHLHNSARLLATSCAIITACVWRGPEAIAPACQAPPQVSLAHVMDLAQLIDSCAARLAITLEYDPALLKGSTITLHVGDSLNDEDVWLFANEVLASRGLTSISRGGIGNGSDRRGGLASEDILSIVRLSDAASQARIEPLWPSGTRAGFVSVLRHARFRSAKDLIEVVKPMLSKPGGAVQELPGESAIVISELCPRLAEIIALLESLDSPDAQSLIEIVVVEHVPATHVTSNIMAAVTASNTVAAEPMQGRLLALPGDSALVLVAPAGEVPRWKALISQFDRCPNLATCMYSPTTLSVDDVARLVGEGARDLGPRGSGDKWRMVPDRMSGVLIITATPAEHERIAALIERLNAIPAAARRPVRAFPIRNRGVKEVVDVLTKLMDAGVLEGAVAPNEAATIGGPAGVDPSMLQRSQRGESAIAGAAAAALTPTTTSAPMSQLPIAAGQAASSNTSSRLTGSSPSALPPLSLTADEATNTLIAVGEPRKLAQLEDLLRTLDVRQPQVMIEVLVVSLSESDTLDLGVELQKIESSGSTVITLASLFGLGGATGADVSGQGFSGLILNPGDFRALIRALQNLNNGRSLNMPKLLVNNNQQANLDAVVQQPFVSTNASDTVATTSFGGFENAGTTITVKPQIAKGDHLVLEYAVSLSAFVGDSSSPGVPPPRQQNTLQSVVTIPDGYTVVVGGIEVTSRTRAVSQVPLLADIPLLGEAFKNRSHTDTRSRFFVFIRPSVLRREGFEDLKYLSDVDAVAAKVDDGFPEVKPRVIR